ncbi:glycosyltransferase [Micromonospora radicis]|uniref:glycosyltransferase n=1 Tax=Micromonospora radicis TaxID=1894971 RepID=UPI0011C46FC5|nr:glycosyltransferase [Micromonospora radicis]
MAVVSEVRKGPDGRWLADGQPLVVRPLAEAGRDGVVLLSDDDLARVRGRSLVTPGSAPAVLVHGAGAVVHAPVRRADGSTGMVGLTPAQLAVVVADSLPDRELLALVSCAVGAVEGGFAQQFAVAYGGDVFAPRTDLRVGSGEVPGGLVTEQGEPWALFVADSVDGQGWDLLNDEVGRPFDGVEAVDSGRGRSRGSSGDGLTLTTNPDDPAVTTAIPTAADSAAESASTQSSAVDDASGQVIYDEPEAISVDSPPATDAAGPAFAAFVDEVRRGADVRLVTAEHLYDIFVEAAEADFVRASGVVTRMHSWLNRLRLDLAIDNLRSAREALGPIGGPVTPGTDDGIRAVIRAIDEVSALSEEAGKQVKEVLEDQAVRAHIAEKTAEQRAKLSSYVDTVRGLIDFLTPAVLPTGAPAVPAAIAAALDLASTAALDAYTSWQRQVFLAEQSSAEALYAHDDDPLTLARMAIDQQKQGFAHVMSLVGIGGAYIPGWSIVSASITKVVDGYLDERLALAERAAQTPDPASGENSDPATTEESAARRAARRAWTELRKEVQAKAGDPEARKTIIDQVQGNGDMLDMAGVGVDLVVAAVLGAALELMPPDPATPVTGADLRAMILTVTGHESTQQETATRLAAPIRELGIEMMPNDLPPTDHAGRKVVRYRATGADDHYRVAIDYHGAYVWGSLSRSGDRRFTPEAPFLLPVTSRKWLNRTINATGYVERLPGVEPRTVTGTWHKPFPNQNNYLFIDADGHAEWVAEMVPTGGMNSDEHNAYREFSSHPDWIRPFIWDPPDVLTVDFAEHRTEPQVDAWALWLFADHAARLLLADPSTQVIVEGGRNQSYGVRPLIDLAMLSQHEDNATLRAKSVRDLLIAQLTERIATLRENSEQDGNAPAIDQAVTWRSRGDNLFGSQAPRIAATRVAPVGAERARLYRQTLTWIVQAADLTPTVPGRPTLHRARNTTLFHTVVPDPTRPAPGQAGAFGTGTLAAGLAAAARAAFAVPHVPLPKSLRIDLVAKPDVLGLALSMGAVFLLHPINPAVAQDVVRVRAQVGDRFTYGSYLLGVFDQISRAEFIRSSPFAAAKVARQRWLLSQAVARLAGHRHALSQPTDTWTFEQWKEVFDDLRSFGAVTERAGHQVKAIIERDAVAAWVKSKPSAQRDRLESYLGYAQQLLGWVANATLPTGVAAAPAAVAAGGKGIEYAALTAYDNWRRDSYLRENSAPEVFLEHDGEPLLMAEAIIAEQKRGFQLLLSLAAIGGAYVPGWPIVEAALTKVAERYLDERLRIIRENPEELVPEASQLSDNPQTRWQKATARLWVGLREEVEAKSKDQQSLLTVGKALTGDVDMLGLIGIVSDVAVVAGVSAVLAVFPPSPAEQVTGEHLRKMILQVVGNNPEARVLTPPELPDQNWSADSLLSGIPSEVLGGHRVLHVTGSELTVDVFGSRVHGRLDNGAFVPDTVEREDFVGQPIWLKRFVGADHYIEHVADGSRRRVDGNWYQPWPGQANYLFVGRDGRVEWAQGMAPSGLMNSDEYNIQTLLSQQEHAGWLKEFHWQAPESLGVAVTEDETPSYDAWAMLQFAHQVANLAADPSSPTIEIVIEESNGRGSGLTAVLGALTDADAERATSRAQATQELLQQALEREWRAAHETRLVSDVPPLPISFTIVPRTDDSGDQTRVRMATRDDATAAPGVEPSGTAAADTASTPPTPQQLANGIALLTSDDATHLAHAQALVSTEHYLVFAHGTTDALLLGTDRISADQLAEMVRADPTWNQQPIVLISCETGQNIDAGFAAQLAQLLPGTTVTAPNSAAWTTAEGQAFVASMEFDADGRPRPGSAPSGQGWRTFVAQPQSGDSGGSSGTSRPPVSVREQGPELGVGGDGPRAPYDGVDAVPWLKRDSIGSPPISPMSPAFPRSPEQQNRDSWESVRKRPDERRGIDPTPVVEERGETAAVVEELGGPDVNSLDPAGTDVASLRKLLDATYREHASVGPQLGPASGATAVSLGADHFGLRTAPPAPQFLQGYPFGDLKPGQRTNFFRALSLTSTQGPTADALAPAALPFDPGSVVTGPPQPVQPGAPAKDRRIPRTLHTIWLGGPLGGHGSQGTFRDNLVKSATASNGYQVVLWTNVTREQIDRARSAVPPPAPGTPEADILDMVAWATEHDIQVLNVDEVFSAEAPMSTESLYKSEEIKRIPSAYAAASDLLRFEILERFGGVYTDSDNQLAADLDEEVRKVSGTRELFALARLNTRVTNAAMIAAAGSGLGPAYAAAVSANYTRPANVNMVRSTAWGEPPDDIAPEVLGMTARNVRTEVLTRTGPSTNVWTPLAETLGYAHRVDLPSMGDDLFTVRSDSSWLKPPPPVPPVVDPAATRARVLEVTSTLIAQLHNNAGNLNLALVRPVVERDADPGAVWTAVIEFLASRPELRSLITSITDHRADDPSAPPLVLPPAAARLLGDRQPGRVLRFDETTGSMSEVSAPDPWRRVRHLLPDGTSWVRLLDPATLVSTLGKWAGTVNPWHRPPNRS